MASDAPPRVDLELDESEQLLEDDALFTPPLASTPPQTPTPRATPRPRRVSRYSHPQPQPSDPLSLSTQQHRHSHSNRDSILSIGQVSFAPTTRFSTASFAPTEGTSATNRSSVYSTFSTYSTGSYAPWWVDVAHNKDEPEEDDWLHDAELYRLHEGGKRRRMRYYCCSARTLIDGTLFVLLLLGIIALFVGYPVIMAFLIRPTGKADGFGLGGTNATGQVPVWAAVGGGLHRDGLIDKDTPESAYERRGLQDKNKVYRLVFSDEFETDGRSFYPGDDPFWEAVDLHYWGTNNYEWYSPDAITTSHGALHITLSEHVSHNLNFRGGMLQSWNKFCFTGGYLSASVRLPGRSTRGGTWPAFWTMGNLGRAGYGATLEGTWPYSYDQCDVGTLPNQTTWDGKPAVAQKGGSVSFNKKHHANVLSFLPGQRLSRCTCPEDDHPGPMMLDGSYRGRSAPEIDVFEAQGGRGRQMEVSQSAQWAPFNMYYETTNKSGQAFRYFPQPEGGRHNSYTGELTQQSTSGVAPAVQEAVQRGGDGSFAEYGFEYRPGDSGDAGGKSDNGYITWTAGGKPTWSLLSPALEADPVAGIGSRPVSQEPMSIIINLGLSDSFGKIDWEDMVGEFPYVMSVDWVRVYQEEGKENVGCDPEGWPTKDYINRHLPAYTNPNYTIWGSTHSQGGYGADWPRNRLQPGGCSAAISKLPGSPTHPMPKAPARAADVAANWEKPKEGAIGGGGEGDGGGAGGDGDG